MPTFYISSMSCINRDYEATLLYNFLKRMGLNYTDSYWKSDYVIVSTCGVCSENIKNNLLHIRYLNNMRKATSKLILMGCLPKIDSHRLNQIDYYHIPPNEIESHVSLFCVRGKITKTDMPESASSFTMPLPVKTMVAVGKEIDHMHLRTRGVSLSGIRSFIKHCTSHSNRQKYYMVIVSKGCSNHCTFCATASAIGPLKSNPPDMVLSEIVEAVSRGHSGIALSSESIASYGRDIGSSFEQLLKKVISVDGVHRISLGAINPSVFIAQPSIQGMLIKNRLRVGNLTISLQSGSQKILGLMNRPANIEKVRESLKSLRKHFTMNSQIIVGFPSEDDADFKDTLRMIREIKFSSIVLHGYSRMPNTPASRMEQVPRSVINKRLKIIKKVQEKFGRCVVVT